MRWLLWCTALVAAAWAGLWVVASRFAERSAAEWLAMQQGTVSAEVSVSGFPNRLDITARDIVAGDTVAGPGWQAPFAQVFSMVWKPWHLIAALPHDQTVILPGGTPVAVGSDRLQASLVLVPGTALALNRLNVAGDALRLAATGAADPLRVETLRLAAHRDAEDPTVLHLGLHAAGILVPPALRAAFPADRPAPDGAIDLRLDARLALSAPLDRDALREPPVPLYLDVTSATMTWGGTSITAAGRLTVLPDGYVDGSLDLDLAGWRTALDLATVVGALRPGVAETWAAFGANLQDAKTGRITQTLVYRNGKARFGLLPIGFAPRLAIP